MAILVRLDEKLYERRMTLTELATRVDITVANLSILKTGKAKAIRFSTLEAICVALDCQPGDLLEFRREDQEVGLIDSAGSVMTRNRKCMGDAFCVRRRIRLTQNLRDGARRRIEILRARGGQCWLHRQPLRLAHGNALSLAPDHRRRRVPADFDAASRQILGTR